jgi:hypothetical protein
MSVDILLVTPKVRRLDLVDFAKTSKSAGNFSELEKLIGRDPGRTGLMQFMELDHGAVVSKEPGLDKPKIHTVRDRQSAHHEGNGETCARLGILRTRHSVDRRAG